MAEIVLEFEKPIAELEAKLAEWESLSSSNNMSVDDELNALKRKIEETKKNIYSSLTPWQRVQLARHPNRPYTLDYIERIFTDFLEFHAMTTATTGTVNANMSRRLTAMASPI